MKKKKADKIEKVLSKEGDFVVYEKNYTRGKTIYYIRGRQEKLLPRVTFEGYLGLPHGLYLSKEGYGFPAYTKGYFFLEVLQGVIPPTKILEFVITKNGKNSFRQYTHKVILKINISDFKHFIGKLILLNRRNNDEVREVVGSYLSSRFPSKIKISSQEYDTYRGGEIAEVLTKKNISSKLNEEDLREIFDFFPKVFNSAIKGRKKILRDLKIRLAKEGKQITDKIFLDEVIFEFEEKIKRKTAKEEDWQVFLKEKVFPFLTNYSKIIDKENIGVDISYPDFVLIDVYGFADVFEIKTHTTSLLSFDSSHDNYYWHTDIVKAISQVENYIDTIKENDSAYVKKVGRKYKIDLTINRPKGFVIAGTYSQIKKDEKAREDFRKLRCSHKNIEFILYDELLNSLQEIQSKLDNFSENKK